MFDPLYASSTLLPDLHNFMFISHSVFKRNFYFELLWSHLNGTWRNDRTTFIFIVEIKRHKMCHRRKGLEVFVFNFLKKACPWSRYTRKKKKRNCYSCRKLTQNLRKIQIVFFSLLLFYLSCGMKWLWFSFEQEEELCRLIHPTVNLGNDKDRNVFSPMCYFWNVQKTSSSLDLCDFLLFLFSIFMVGVCLHFFLHLWLPEPK